MLRALVPLGIFSLLILLLAAGLEGIEKGYELSDPIEADLFRMTREERLEYGVVELPSSLDEAIRYAEESELLANVLGPKVMESILRNKRIEWREYASTVTDFETKRYFRQL